MTLKDRARAFLARFQRKPGWPDPAKDETHANYRRQYETLLPQLKHLPRGDAYEERQAYLFLAEILIGLHNYGDDPIMPPGVKRIIERVRAEDERPPVLVRRNVPPVAARFLGPLAGVQLWQALAIGWAVTFGMLGVQTARVASLKGDVREMADTARANAATAQRWQERAEEYREGLIDAAGVAREAANALEAERLANVRRAERERRRNREVANVLARSPDAPEWRLRDDGGQTEDDGTTP